jgi:lysyl-tRNA synthetase class II
MLKPDQVEKVGEILREFKAFQAKFDELTDDEFRQKKMLIDLIADHLQAQKQLKRLEVIRYLDNN